jgi:hypothetical protein
VDYSLFIMETKEMLLERLEMRADGISPPPPINVHGCSLCFGGYFLWFTMLWDRDPGPFYRSILLKTKISM